MSHAVPATEHRASGTARLAGYLAAGVGSSMLATSNAEAAVIAINLSNCGTNNQNITGVNAGMAYGAPKKTVLGFVPGGNLELYFRTSEIGLDADDGASRFEFATGGTFSSPTNFSGGTTILGSSAAAWSGTSTRTLFKYYALSPNFGAGSFMGFRFSTDGGTNWNYGYIEVLWNYTGTDSTSSFQLLSAAYESTAGLGITTPSAVPSAGGLMALMALGGGAFRRRGRSA